VIETERLLLRPPEERDVEAVYRFVADPEVMRWLGDNGRTGTYADAAPRMSARSASHRSSASATGTTSR
jgi:RimJ/RimL family protein N-acetyltransferase